MDLGLVALPTFGFASALPRALDIVGELVMVVGLPSCNILLNSPLIALQALRCLLQTQNTRTYSRQGEVQGVFFNWPSPEFAKCWPVSDQFQKKS